MVTKETISALFEILQSMSSIILGISFAVFTLAYGFIQNKKDTLKDVEELLKNEGASASLLRKYNSSIKFIARFKLINKDAIILVFMSFVGLLFSYIDSFIEIAERWNIYFCVFMVLWGVIVIFFLGRMTFRLLSVYRK